MLDRRIPPWSRCVAVHRRDAAETVPAAAGDVGADRRAGRLIAANRQGGSIEALLSSAALWVLTLEMRAARTKAGLTSDRCCLHDLFQHSWGAT